uniref:Uncharacterized protein n=1 Tax=Anguilla anguilla TaxID=7936 RepID=A0A0E9TKX0_ANGAN
MDTRPLKLTD